MKGFIGKIGGFFKKMYKKLGIKKLILICILIIVIVALVLLFTGKEEKVTASNATATAKIGNVIESVEQSGTIEPYERREITALVRGEVISSPFKEGDFVNEGDTLYRIDDEDAQLSLEKSQINLSEVNKNISNLNIYASASGTLTNFNLSVGDSVKEGEIGKIVNNSSMKVRIPFTAADFDKISVGDSVSVTSASYMMTLNGTVTYKLDSNAGTGSDGSYLKEVEVTIQNPGSLSSGVTVAGNVQTKSGTVYSAKSGSVESGGTTSLRAESSGTVATLRVKNGDKVSKGQLIATLTNDTLINNKKSTELSMKSERKNLDDYNITAPISGTVITKNVEAGDKIDNSNSQTILMVVADMSKMKFTISVDELDVGDIALMQSVTVDADALPGKIFNGYVSKIASEGTVSGLGVTTYDVEIVVDEPGELKPGMNVNANIIISETRDVLTIPEEALNGARDGKAMVYIKTGKESENAVFPKDYESREIEYGTSNGTVVEVKSGLSEGETVIYVQYSGSSDDFMSAMRGMAGGQGGGMPGGGGMPSGGGQGGGMPGGGGNRGGGQGGR